MKKLVFLPLIFSMFLFYTMDAHADNDVRNRCNLFTKRYYSFTRTQGNDDIDIFPCRNTDRDCNLSSAFCESRDGGEGSVLDFGPVCATAVAGASANNPNFVQTQAFNGCSAGLGLSDLSKLMINNLKGSSVPSTTRFEYDVVFDEVNRTTSVKDGNGKLVISKSSLMYVELRFTLWLAQDDYINQVQDTSMTPDKVVVQEFIRIRNNQVIISDGLRHKKTLNITETDEIISIELINFEHAFEVPEGVNMNDLVARTSAFSEFDNERFAREISEVSNEKPNFHIAPNPNDGNFTIRTIDVPSNQKIEVKLFNFEGALIRTLYNGYFSKEKNEAIALHANELSEGVYFLLIIGQGFVETKKLIIAKQ